MAMLGVVASLLGARFAAALPEELFGYGARTALASVVRAPKLTLGYTGRVLLLYPHRDERGGGSQPADGGRGPFRKLAADEVREIAPFVYDDRLALYREPTCSRSVTVVT